MHFIELLLNKISGFFRFLVGQFSATAEEPRLLTPKTIKIVEEYNFRARLAGIRSIKETPKPSGEIDFHIPLNTDKHRPPNWSSNALLHMLLSAQYGQLHITEYGQSDLSLQHEVNLDDNILPIQPQLVTADLETVVRKNNKYADLHLTHGYSPQPLQLYPLVVCVQVIDEDYAEQEDQQAESITETLLRQVKEQIGLMHTLILRFHVTLTLPAHFSVRYEKELPTITQVSLNWPISTPHQVATIKVGNKPNSTFLEETNKSNDDWITQAFTYDPEAGCIQFKDITMYMGARIDEHQPLVYETAPIQIEISEPAEFYHLDEVDGCVSVELDGLYSGLIAAYETGIDNTSHDVDISYSTLIKNTIIFRLSDGLQQKCFSPRQYLYFPGVILNDERIADVMMLLQEKGYSPEQLEYKPSQPTEDNKYDRSCIIKATKIEGARIFLLLLVIHGEKSATTRERGIQGDAKYTTPLGAGNTKIYIRGQVTGDSKRITKVVNEIQLQLKEQFHHVGTTV